MLGPARSVRAWGWSLLPERTTLDGTPFRIGSPDLIVTAVELESGAVLRLTASFYVGRPARQIGGIEFHGDAGSLALGNFQDFDTTVEVGAFGKSIRAGPAGPAGLSRNGLGSRRGGHGERDRRGPAAPRECGTGRPRGGHPRGRGEIHRGRRQPDRDHVQLRAAVAHALGGRWGPAGRRSLGTIEGCLRAALCVTVALMRLLLRDRHLRDRPHWRVHLPRPDLRERYGLAGRRLLRHPGKPTTSGMLQHHPCSEPHTAEVFYIGDHPAAKGSPFTHSLLNDFARSSCVPALSRHTSARPRATGSTISSRSFPGRTAGPMADRKITCYAYPRRRFLAISLVQGLLTATTSPLAYQTSPGRSSQLI